MSSPKPSFFTKFRKNESSMRRLSSAQIEEESNFPDPIKTFQEQNASLFNQELQKAPMIPKEQIVPQQQLQPLRAPKKEKIESVKLTELNKSMFEILQFERNIRPPLWLYQNNSRAYNEMIEETLRDFEHDLVFED